MIKHTVVFLTGEFGPRFTPMILSRILLLALILVFSPLEVRVYHVFHVFYSPLSRRLRCEIRSNLWFASLRL